MKINPNKSIKQIKTHRYMKNAGYLNWGYNLERNEKKKDYRVLFCLYFFSSWLHYDC